MKRIIYLSLLAFLVPQMNWAQESTSTSPTKYSKPNYIRGGFYLKLGPVLPVGNFALGQNFIDPDGTLTYFDPARIGGNLGMGYLIYIGPGVANNYLRFGIDAGFLDFWFATSNHTIQPGTDEKSSEFWYYFAGQKFGPLITVNPVDKLMIDLSYKLNANLSWHNSDWGANILGHEVMMNIRYRVILLSVLYNTGTVNYNDFDKNRPDHKTDISTFRILLGFKF
jgi:hypothetical protein